MKFLIKLLSGLFVGTFFVLWLYKSIDIHKLISMSKTLDFKMIGFSMGFYGCALLSRIFRWKKLLGAPLKLRQVGAALLVGYAMNVILPARLGELFRANICKTWYGIPRSNAFASIVLERIADGITVLFCLVLGLISLNALQAEMIGMLIGGSVLFGSALLGVIFLKKIPIHSIFHRFPKIQSKVLNVQSAFGNLPRKKILSLVPMSLFVWTFEGLSLWAMVQATGCSMTFLGTALLIGAVSLSTLLPSPPGFLGTMQFAFAIALSSVGFSTESGVLAATLTQIFLIGSLALFGVILYAAISLKNRLKTA